MATRTFLALPLGPGMVDRLVRAQQELMRIAAHVRWVARENLHLTVKFLGSVEDGDLAEVCRVARELAGRCEPFEFVVRGLTAVPPAGQMRMVWAGVEEPSGRLARLAQAVEEAYAAMGFKRETRRFRPHLTLGRVKSGKNVAELRAGTARFAETDFGSQRAEELVVFASELTPHGPVYSSLAKAPLGRD